jgi:hypothetical protein
VLEGGGGREPKRPATKRKDVAVSTPPERRSTRPRFKPARFGGGAYSATMEPPPFPTLPVPPPDVDPKTFRQAMASPQKELWWKAMVKEVGNLRTAGTYKLVDRSTLQVEGPSARSGSTKRNATPMDQSQSTRHDLSPKASPRCLGSTGETYSPVVKGTSERTILALAAVWDLELHSMDVTAAFLNGVMKEVVYIRSLSSTATTKEPTLSPGTRCIIRGQITSTSSITGSARGWRERSS